MEELADVKSCLDAPASGHISIGSASQMEFLCIPSFLDNALLSLPLKIVNPDASWCDGLQLNLIALPPGPKGVCGTRDPS